MNVAAAGTVAAAVKEEPARPAAARAPRGRDRGRPRPDLRPARARRDHGHARPEARRRPGRGQQGTDRRRGEGGEELPAEYADAKAIDTGGTIFPGLIDLHNHFAYNIRPLWPLPKRYDNRSQWGTPLYSAEVSKPVKAIAGSYRTARYLVRYVEAKALIGGTTTGQGIKTQVNGGWGSTTA